MTFYALGGGRGHAVRAYALWRALKRWRPQLEARILLPARLRSWADCLGLPVLCPPPPAQESPAQLRDWFLESVGSPRLLVVDVFPRGVLGELAPILAQLPYPRVLVTRWVRPAIYRQFLDDLRGYAQVIWTEPPPEDLLLGGLVVEPVLGVDPEEVLPGPGTHLVALASGPEAEQAGLRAFLQGRVGDRLRLFSDFPAGAWLRQARLVVSAAGYQSYYEIVQAGVPAILCPQPRRWDDQSRRALGGMGIRPGSVVVVESVPELEEALDRWWPQAPAPGPVRPLRGAAQVAQRLAEWL